MARRVKCRKLSTKATEAAKRALIRVPLREGRTLHHDVQGRHGAGRVILRAAPAGTGIIAGHVFETLGMHDVVAKSQGSSNPYNMIRATFDALQREDSPRSVAARRGASRCPRSSHAVQQCGSLALKLDRGGI